MLQLQINHYDDVVYNPDALLVDREQHRGLSSLQVLEHLVVACAGSRADFVRFRIIQEASGRTMYEGQLARTAYTLAQTYPEYRERFAAWLANRVTDVLWPWDDCVAMPVPPPSYERRAATLVRRLLQDEPAGWLRSEFRDHALPLTLLTRQLSAA